jgi:pimeloyl-ACP methyl ester carboxylesterase
VTGEALARRYEIEGGGGLKLDACEWGDPRGPALLLIHGWSQSRLCWQRQVESHLADTFRIVAFDNRGHGMSDKPLTPDHYVEGRLWADDVAAVIDQTELERPIVVAWSYGGFIVADYVRAYGQAGIAGINLVGAAVLLKPPGFDHIGRGFLENAEGACSPELATNIAAITRFLRACTALPLDDGDWNAALSWNMLVPPAVRGALLSRELDAGDVLSALTVPVVVSHGRADAIVQPSMAEHVLAVCKTAEPSWYEGVGHMPFWEDDERFNRELAALRARVD